MTVQTCRPELRCLGVLFLSELGLNRCSLDFWRCLSAALKANVASLKVPFSGKHPLLWFPSDFFFNMLINRRDVDC